MAFLLVYIREAHAIDGLHPLAGEGMPILEEPTSLVERNAAARRCRSALALDGIPSLVDGLDDTVSRAYAAWPDRLYLIDREGLVAFHGFEGPEGFDLDGLEAAIVNELARARR